MVSLRGPLTLPSHADRDSLLLRYGDALGALSRSALLRAGDVQAAYRELTEVGARTLEVDRVSVWLADAARDAITCQDLYRRDANVHELGAVLTRDGHPVYFAALDTCRVIDANDACSDPRTAEFCGDYLVPLGITSMLDAPVVAAGAYVGVVCFEHCGSPRAWGVEEQTFAASLADFAALATETSRRLHAEADARLRAEQLALAVGAASLGVWSYELPSGAIHWSERVVELFGGTRPDSFESYLALIHPQDRDALSAAIGDALASRRSFVIGHRLAWGRRDRVLECRGAVVLDERGEVVGMTGVMVDISERTRLEEQLRQSQKMESVGRLAGGIAHDFNNLLTAIAGHADRLRLRLAPGSHERSSAEVILTAVERATGLTSQLLAFARKRPIELCTIDIVATLQQLAALMRRLLREDIELRLSLPERPLPVRVDPSQIEQLVLNLAINAQDAMPEGGLLELTLAEAAAQGEEHAALAVLTVRDTGCGMDADTAERAFEPFFTTKEVGRGTGLGLSICYGVVHQAGGRIELRSELGQGTTFEVRLPLVDEAIERVIMIDAARDAGVRVEGGHETILLVEDEKLLRDLTAMLLREAGYDVLEAGDGDAALALSAASTRHIHLALCDVVLPGVRGGELLRRLCAQRAGLRVVFMSGYVDDAASSDAALRDAPLLAKPFSRDDLMTAVRSALDARA